MVFVQEWQQKQEDKLSIVVVQKEELNLALKKALWPINYLLLKKELLLFI